MITDDTRAEAGSTGGRSSPRRSRPAADGPRVSTRGAAPFSFLLGPHPCGRGKRTGRVREKTPVHTNRGGKAATVFLSAQALPELVPPVRPRGLGARLHRVPTGPPQLGSPGR